MIIYNVTINIELSVKDEWLRWMKQEHIPDVMKTGMFKSYILLHLIGDEDSGGVTYCIQYLCESMEKYQQYQDIYAPALRGELNHKFKEKFVAFRTLLETVE